MPLIPISHHIIIFLLFGSISVLFSQSTNHCTITGKVTDSTTGLPLHLVNVYLSGTTFGASTSQTGSYCMENVRGGSYQLIFQHIGYEIKAQNMQIEDNQIYEIDAQLLPKIYDSEEIQISTTDPTEWRNQLNFFIKRCIGESQNADHCEILNPWVLNFHVDEETDNFIASTDSIIRIINNSLGYQLNIVLVDFRCKDEFLTYYRIHPKFALLEAKDNEEQERWVENRQRTYQSSLKHFLTALARGQIMEEKFNMSGAININWLKDGHGYYVPADSLKIEDTYVPLYKKFFLDDYLMVTYSSKQIYVSSIIKFNQDYIIIDTLGNVLAPYVVNRSGAWYKARVADTLPMEYLPTN
jgi:hypothetical protein